MHMLLCDRGAAKVTDGAIDGRMVRCSSEEGGKSAIHMARVYGERKRNFVGQHFWAWGFFVNTVGRDEEAIRAYIRNQEKEDQRLEQMNLWR